MDPNREDQKDIEALQSGQPVSRFVPNRFRQKLKNVSRQLKAAASSGCPTLLVVYDNTPFKLYSGNRQIVQAMFGRHTVSVRSSGPGHKQPAVSEPFFGGDRGLTPSQNTSVSALALLDGGPTSVLSLRVYHNPYASVVLRPGMLAAFPSVQEVLPEDTTVDL
ncbi:MAG TPA: hypothetical protein VKA53_06270 [Thermoanaerobaculia bacterium]|nr:hypothetical protein [Thermoanaerobaculia bacterium]